MAEPSHGAGPLDEGGVEMDPSAAALAGPSEKPLEPLGSSGPGSDSSKRPTLVPCERPPCMVTWIVCTMQWGLRAVWLFG